MRRLAILFAISLIPVGALAQSRPTEIGRPDICDPKPLTRAGFTMSIFDEIGGSPTPLSSYPDSPILSIHGLQGAPLWAVGKITKSNDANASASCTATLIQKDLIVTSSQCLPDFIQSYGSGPKQPLNQWFFPASRKIHSAPYSGAQIVKKWKSRDVAIAKISPKMDGAPTTNWRSVRIADRSHWGGSPTWLLVGYQDSQRYTATVESGCRLKDVTPNTYISHDCEGSFLNGLPIFGRIGGQWQLVAIYDNYVLSLHDAFNLMKDAYDESGYSIIGTEICGYRVATPPTTTFMDTLFPGRLRSPDPNTPGKQEQRPDN